MPHLPSQGRGGLESFQRSYQCTSLWSGHYSTRWTFKSCIFWYRVVVRNYIDVLTISSDMSMAWWCFNQIWSRSQCSSCYSSWNGLVTWCYPYFCVAWYRWQRTNPVTSIKISLLSLFEQFVLFAKFFKILGLWKIRSELPSHGQFCRKKITPGKGSSPVVKEWHVWIVHFFE